MLCQKVIKSFGVIIPCECLSIKLLSTSCYCAIGHPIRIKNLYKSMSTCTSLEVPFYHHAQYPVLQGSIEDSYYENNLNVIFFIMGIGS